jgi:hypothetical protein
MQTNALMAYGFHVNQHLFPTMYRSTAFSLTSATSKPFSGAATIVVEYIKNPMSIILVSTCCSFISTFLIIE